MQALSFLPGIKSDMGELVLSDVVYGPQTAAADTTAKSAAASDLSGTAHSSNNISSSTSGSSSSHEPQLPEHLLPPEERAQRSAIHAKPATSAGAAANANASGTGSSGGSTVGGSNDAVWRVDTCAFHQLLSAEGCPELLSEFCCQYSLQWLRAYEKYGVQVSHEACMAWGDACCKVRIAKGQ